MRLHGDRTMPFKGRNHLPQFTRLGAALSSLQENATSTQPTAMAADAGARCHGDGRRSS